jgi:hypothetical protein
MPISGFGNDFFDSVLGTSSDMLGGFMNNLPQTPLPDYPEPDPFLGVPSYDVAPGAIDPFAEALNTAINSGRYAAPGGGAATPGQGGLATQAARGPVIATGDTNSGYRANVAPQGELVDYARKVATAYGIDPDIFVRQINQESGFKPTARSGAGAQGVAQFMPATAARYGVDVNDPYSSLDGAARHMRDLLKAFNGDWRLALAAYNAGEGAVRKYGGVPPYEETQTYVRNIYGR